LKLQIELARTHVVAEDRTSAGTVAVTPVVLSTTADARCDKTPTVEAPATDGDCRAAAGGQRYEEEEGPSGTAAAASIPHGQDIVGIAVNPEPHHSSSAEVRHVSSPANHRAVETTLRIHLDDSFRKVQRVVRGWIDVEDLWQSSRSSLHISAAIITALIVLCLVFLSYYAGSCEPSCLGTFSRTGLQFRYIAPPPV